MPGDTSQEELLKAAEHRADDVSAVDEPKDSATDETDGEKLSAELAAALARAENYYRRLLRMEADFENFRRRSRQEKQETEERAAEKVITSLLPILDHLELALASTRQSRDLEALVAGLEMVSRGFRHTLEKEGLTALAALGQEFDPNQHEAVAQILVEDDAVADNTVVEELQKGYRLKGKLIRPARVTVAQKPPAKEI